jgi:hypothetical protein
LGKASLKNGKNLRKNYLRERNLTKTKDIGPVLTEFSFKSKIFAKNEEKQLTKGRMCAILKIMGGKCFSVPSPPCDTCAADGNQIMQRVRRMTV